MAFVAGSSFVGAKVGTVSAVSKRPAVSRSTKSVVRMVAQRGDDEEYFSPTPGFNIFNEQLNGRLAMIGFGIGVGTELFNPNHPTIVQQIQIILSNMSLTIS
mmetsp:Transcript_5179/g.22234  ORF Transcript_5179/g.22234 Transcript_5179/m.22234 type:complete len:102 (-) Transcript_5179:225-530(-)|eukprot:CAMPEP_0113963052 /NCGR_PEP_ID=MMETSP0011_2-20120614/6286_1 /TAXON_ID=101924 /ORGANISM="Rhodosorus marinus" /LENGTH=101 /DNA_ID=CAMNT_0000975033 /DNA_START=78 /DNA_END=383 /DNA_ORIENTATION=+ /assembly_acc=CAM_ASM_000156